MRIAIKENSVKCFYSALKSEKAARVFGLPFYFVKLNYF